MNLDPCTRCPSSTVIRVFADESRMIRGEERTCAHRTWIARVDPPRRVDPGAGTRILPWPPASTRPVAPLDARPEPGGMSYR